MAASILNPFTKRSVKVKSLNDMTTKEKFSPLTSNLISKYGVCLPSPCSLAAGSAAQGQAHGRRCP